MKVPHIEWRAGTQLEPVADVILLDVNIAADRNLAQSALDDQQCDGAIGNPLIGDHRTRIDVTVIDIVKCDTAAQILELFGRNGSADERSSYFGKLFLAEDGISLE